MTSAAAILPAGCTCSKMSSKETTSLPDPSDALDINLLVFAADEGVAEHVNDQVDVLLVGIAGAGTVTIDGRQHELRAGRAVVVPKGSSRGTRALTERFAYLTCHRRRPGLIPALANPAGA